MRLAKSPTPKVNRTALPSTMFGYCCECGKNIAVRNSDGMIRKHKSQTTGLRCTGSFMCPSKAAATMYDPKWAPPRRSN